MFTRARTYERIVLVYMTGEMIVRTAEFMNSELRQEITILILYLSIFSQKFLISLVLIFLVLVIIFIT